MKELPDQKKGSIAGALSLHDVLLEALNTKTDSSDDTNNTNNESIGTNNANGNEESTKVHGECVETIDV